MSGYDRFRTARSLVGESASPAFLVDAEGRIRAWNPAATGFFGIPAWMASAHRCAEVVRGLGCVEACPLTQARVAPTEAVTRFDLRGVPGASVRHLPVHDPGGRLLGMVHLLSPVGEATT